MSLDDATTGFLAMVADSGAPALHHLPVPDARAMAAGGAQMSGPGPEVASTLDRTVTAGGAAVTVRLLSPVSPVRAIVVLYHGGGWVHGGLEEYDHLGRRLAVDLGAVVVLVDYRLAPEHPFPAAVDDAATALRWVCEHVEELAGDAAG